MVLTRVLLDAYGPESPGLPHQVAGWRTRGRFEAPAETRALGHGTKLLVRPAARWRLQESRSHVSRFQQPALVNSMSRRIQKLIAVVGSALLVAFGAGASYRPF